MDCHKVTGYGLQLMGYRSWVTSRGDFPLSGSVIAPRLDHGNVQSMLRRLCSDWAGMRVDRNPLIALIFRFSLQGIPPMSKPAKSQNTQTFESALAELENIVAGMEEGQMPLEQSLAAYKRGAELLKFCQAQLADAQQQVKILEDGVLKNFGVAEQ